MVPLCGCRQNSRLLPGVNAGVVLCKWLRFVNRFETLWTQKTCPALMLGQICFCFQTRFAMCYLACGMRWP